jgi:quinol-cytochrome oxidoreductase complex cytochrome b subunit
VILPLTIFAIIGIHLAFVQVQGMAPPLGRKRAPRSMKFFPSFATRDLLLWLVALIVLSCLALFLPYGPGIPGIDWELGQKADPLAPAYPGIKPEWYFLWVYQLLKEFPPHLFGMEGPQAALLLVNALFAAWLLVPWLDRRARREQASPGFTDFGVGALLFTAWLTLKAWDIGGGGGDEPDAQAVAFVTGWIVLGLAATVTLLRAVRGQRWFVYTGAVALHVVLHGLLGLSYLLGGVIALGAAAVGVALLELRARRPAPGAAS